MIGSLNTNAREVTIVGAGIAGMLAGYNLDQQGYRVTLLEEKERAGGLIQTSVTPFGIAESAAHSLVVTGAVLNLCQELGVELIEPRKEARACEIHYPQWKTLQVSTRHRGGRSRAGSRCPGLFRHQRRIADAGCVGPSSSGRPRASVLAYAIR